MSVISDIKMILESNSIHLLYDARLCTEQKERWDAIKDADLVEVVRCKYCRYRFKNKWFCCDGRCLDDDNFCNYGKRKEDDKG